MKEALEEALVGSFHGISVKQDPDDPLTLVVIVPEGLLRFGIGQFTITENSLSFIKSFTPDFVGIVCGDRFNGKIDSLLVEGHTDSSSDDNFNLALSQKRSLEVMLKMVSHTESFNDCFLELTSASGRGERDLIFDHLGYEDSPRSRRVQYKIRVKSSLNEELKNEMSAAL